MATGSQYSSPATEPLSTHHSRTSYRQLPANARVTSLEAQHDLDAARPLLRQHQGSHQQGSWDTRAGTTNVIEDLPTSKSIHQEHLVLPKGWPTSPQPIKLSRVFVTLGLVLDTFLLALSLGFLALGLFTYSYNNMPVLRNERATQALMELSNLGPTVFPLLFACAVGRAIQAVLNWRLEKGLAIGTADLLAGSTSLVSTITSQIQLGAASITSVSLVMLWMLSPLGGQASLRQISLGPSTSDESMSFTYISPSDNLTEFAVAYFGTIEYYLGPVNNVFESALTAPPLTKRSPLDQWGNVKIPMLEPLENDSAADSQGWFDVNNYTSTYASLVGTPVTLLKQDDSIKYSFTMEASYFYLRCSVVKGQYLGRVPSSAGTSFNAAWIWSNDDSQERCEMEPGELQPRSFTYVTLGPTASASNCTISTTYVEAQVFCPGTSDCAVSKLRRSQEDHLPAGYTVLDPWVNQSLNNDSNWNYFRDAFSTAEEGSSESPGSIVQNYLVSPDNPLLVAKNMSVSNEEYAVRLGQLMNAYWACLTGMQPISNGLSASIAWNVSINGSTFDTSYLTYSNTTSGILSKTSQIIICHIGWMVALCIISAILVIASAISILARHHSHAPELIFNISSLATRGNRYFNLPTTGTALSGAERARLLKDRRVQFGDVNPRGKNGKLVIASPGTLLEESWVVERARKGRSYV